MDDAAIWGALITSIGGMLIALMDNRRLRARDRLQRAARQDDTMVKLRIREVEEISEFRTELRETVRDQAETITRLGTELEKSRLERLKFEEERLEWSKKRRQLEEELAIFEGLVARVEALERSLGESERREAELAETLRRERNAWAMIREAFEQRIHSLELVLRAAGVPLPLELEQKRKANSE